MVLIGLFVRKHHCRKCGRVVCNSCSPHRITIPFQYIVQPPFECATPLPASCRTRPERELERMGSSIEVASLGGGERVRLCNPCVPDPNIAPPQTNSGQSQQAISSPARHGRSASGAIWTYGPYQGPQIQPNRQTGPISVREALANTPRRPREPIIFGNNDGPSYFSRPVERGSSYNHREDPRLGMDAMEPRSRSSTVGAPSRESHHMNNAFTPTGEAVTTAPQRYSSLIPRIGSDLSRPLPPSPQPRTQIPEEDECWVCHKELPSRTLPDFENQRSQHVESCIISAMRGSSPSPARPTQNTSTAITAPAAPSTSQPRVGSPSPAQVRRTGVFPYIATEKDCVDDAECTICLEEFEVGIEMGRLECFCRFHLKCIRHWFGSKPGQCPVHQHAGGY
ncbi:hypothetical protein BJ875DRAFT_4074 [Amylocarpus encephaloides]|uniref:RING-type E3 ubiquitin transferase n=1 Tax=Amylocarpus encephaloides TaxID=45428 RepID=A0A9P7YT87_9HELO|nr:hypothetical protein BJ875DRAFT_4074 [Amylocarpus encephaloides]